MGSLPWRRAPCREGCCDEILPRGRPSGRCGDGFGVSPSAFVLPRTARTGVRCGLWPVCLWGVTNRRHSRSRVPRQRCGRRARSQAPVEESVRVLVRWERRACLPNQRGCHKGHFAFMVCVGPAGIGVRSREGNPLCGWRLAVRSSVAAAPCQCGRLAAERREAGLFHDATGALDSGAGRCGHSAVDVRAVPSVVEPAGAAGTAAALLVRCLQDGQLA